MEEWELSEVFDRRFKHADVVLAGDVFVQAGSDALAVAHFAEDPAVGGRDALDGVQRAVGVEVDVGGGIAVQINVLGGDLAIGRQLADQEARNLPSPWEMGTLYTSPTLVSASHGDLLEATRVRTMRLWWREMLLKVRVGQVSSVSMILP